MELKPVLLARNLILNSDAVLDYKYMFGPQRILNFICETSRKREVLQKQSAPILPALNKVVVLICSTGLTITVVAAVKCLDQSLH